MTYKLDPNTLNDLINYRKQRAHETQKGKLDPKYGSIYQSLFEKRQSGDYEDFVYCDEEMYSNLKPQASDFVQQIGELVRV